MLTIDDNDTIWITLQGKVRKFTVDFKNEKTPRIVRHPGLTHSAEIINFCYNGGRFAFVDLKRDLYTVNRGKAEYIANISELVNQNGIISTIIFDDDDILFSNWVEEFKKCAEENEGRILHSFAFAQDWENLEKLGYCAVAAPSANYCVPFNLINQLSVNRCPLMTLAFPVNIFQKAGIIFNESLNVTEDWEYFMRTAFLCGVSDIEAPTAIYRFWKNIETSATLHDQENWDATYHSVQETYNSQNIILPAGNIRRIIELSTAGKCQWRNGKSTFLQ